MEEKGENEKYDFFEAEIKIDNIVRDVNNDNIDEYSDYLKNLFSDVFKFQDFISSVIVASSLPFSKVNIIAELVSKALRKFISLKPTEHINSALSIYTKIFLRSSGNLSRALYNICNDFVDHQKMIQSGYVKYHFLDKIDKYKGLKKIPKNLIDECNNVIFFQKIFNKPIFSEWFDYGHPLDSYEYHISIDDLDYIKDKKDIFTKTLSLATAAEILVHPKLSYNPNVSALNFAAYHGATKCFKYILANNSNNSDWDKTLKYAIYARNREVCDICMSKGYNFKKAFKNSAKYNFNSLFHELRESELFKEEMYPSLSKIVEWKNIELIRFYLETLKWDKNDNQEADSNVMKPLHIACANGFFGVATHLVDKCHVDPNLPGLNGNLPYSYACESGWPTLGDVLSARGGHNGGVTLQRAAEIGFRTTMCSILNFGFDHVNSVDAVGETALFKACSQSRLGCVIPLLHQYKADPNINNPDGNSPLHEASKNLDLEIAQELIKAGANKNAVNRFGKTPLDMIGERAGEKDPVIVEMNLLLGKYDI